MVMRMPVGGDGPPALLLGECNASFLLLLHVCISDAHVLGKQMSCFRAVPHCSYTTTTACLLYKTLPPAQTKTFFTHCLA